MEKINIPGNNLESVHLFDISFVNLYHKLPISSISNNDKTNILNKLPNGTHFGDDIGGDVDLYILDF